MSNNPDFTAQWGELRVPLNDATGTFLKSSSIFEAKEYKSGFVYDETTDTMTDTNTGVVYSPRGLRQLRLAGGQEARTRLDRRRRPGELRLAAHRPDDPRQLLPDHDLDVRVRVPHGVHDLRRWGCCWPSS